MGSLDTGSFGTITFNVQSHKEKFVSISLEIKKLSLEKKRRKKIRIIIIIKNIRKTKGLSPERWKDLIKVRLVSTLVD